MGVVAALGRFNGHHPWSHNDFYLGWVAARIRESGAREVLDIGCGTGNLLARLCRDADHLTGLEPDPRSADIAAARFAGTDAVTVVCAPFTGPLEHRRPAITAVAVLHHMPLDRALREVRESLAPGGRLVVVGCYRDAGFADHVAGTISAVVNPVIGLFVHPRRARSLPDHMRAPTAEPLDTLAAIRDAAGRELPGARIRRRMFWRYTLVYDRPADGTDSSER
ncbi:class I SAM-dependent methyltransferase [Nocardia sp. NPDC024068]|uniref:class I SAM-dependent methyltransferase n=1 Tax=Nocardia sp. NPDC024068 TaxID=3157197 RepID=UPI0033F55A4F